MASSLSRRLCNSILSKSKTSHISMPFCTNLSSPETSDSDDSTLHSLSSPSPSPPPPSSSESTQQRTIFDRPLENGLDVGIYKAIIVGQVGQSPLQKRLKGGRTVTLLSVGTGGIRNNRRPLDNEEPRDYANRCAVQWHRVSIYPERLGDIAMKHAIPGVIRNAYYCLYPNDCLIRVERHGGNLETKVYSDPISGLVRRIREIAVRANGRLVFLGKGDDAQQPSQTELKGVGYY